MYAGTRDLTIRDETAGAVDVVADVRHKEAPIWNDGIVSIKLRR